MVENNKTITRFNTLKIRYEQIKEQLSTKKIKSIKKDISEQNVLQNAVKSLTEKTFTNLPLEQIGSQPWKQLWESAKRFYEHSTHQKFPNLDENSVCPLCLQNLDNEAKSRFSNFDEFVQTDIQNQLNTVNQKLSTLLKEVQNVNLDFSEIQSTIAELNTISESFTEQHNHIMGAVIPFSTNLLTLLQYPIITS